MNSNRRQGEDVTHHKIYDLGTSRPINRSSISPKRESQSNQGPISVYNIEDFIDRPIRLPYELVFGSEGYYPIPHEDGIVGYCAHLRDEDECCCVWHVGEYRYEYSMYLSVRSAQSGRLAWSE